MKNINKEEPFRKYYSQHGEDYTLWKYFDFKTTGFFVDVGAFDGKYISNSFSFDENGWKGICIEPIQKYYKLCKENRKNSLCFNMAISGEDSQEKIDFFEDDLGLYASCEYSAENEEYVRKCYESDGIEFKGFKKYQVKTTTLNKIFEEKLVSNQKIDFLSIDVEGLELAVLKGLDIDFYSPEVIIIEANTNKAKNNIINEILTNSDYIFVKQIGVNLFFTKQDNSNKLMEIKINCLIEKQVHPMGVKNSIKDLLQGVIIFNNKRIYPNINDFLKEKKRENYRLENRIKNKNTELEEIRREKEILNSKNEDKQRENYRLENRIKNKNTELEEIKREKEILNCKNKEKQKENYKLGNRIGNKNTELDKRRRKNEIFAHRCREKERENYRLENRINNKNKKLEELTRRVKVFGHRNREKERENYRLKNRIEEKNKEINTLRKSLSEITYRFYSLYNHVNGLLKANIIYKKRYYKKLKEIYNSLKVKNEK